MSLTCFHISVEMHQSSFGSGPRLWQCSDGSVHTYSNDPY